MTQKPIDQLSDPELVEAGQNLADLEGWARRQCTDNRTGGWSFVFDKLADAREALESEVARRQGLAAS